MSISYVFSTSNQKSPLDILGRERKKKERKKRKFSVERCAVAHRTKEKAEEAGFGKDMYPSAPWEFRQWE